MIEVTSDAKVLHLCSIKILKMKKGILVLDKGIGSGSSDVFAPCCYQFFFFIKG